MNLEKLNIITDEDEQLRITDKLLNSLGLEIINKYYIYKFIDTEIYIKYSITKEGEEYNVYDDKRWVATIHNLKQLKCLYYVLNS